MIFSVWALAGDPPVEVNDIVVDFYEGGIRTTHGSDYTIRREKGNRVNSVLGSDASIVVTSEVAPEVVHYLDGLTPAEHATLNGKAARVWRTHEPPTNLDGSALSNLRRRNRLPVTPPEPNWRGFFCIPGGMGQLYWNGSADLARETQQALDLTLLETRSDPSGAVFTGLEAWADEVTAISNMLRRN